MSIKASGIPRVPASDENNESHPEMGSNVQTTKKFIPKHYMYQTVSAASKVAVPRKKILGERNAAPESMFSDSHIQKAPIESKMTFVNPGTDISDISSPQGFESDDNGENVLVADVSLRPYDPLTNYLSPRPKFLRYMPNRRREIFLRREKNVKEGKDESYISTSGSLKFGKASGEESDSVCGLVSLPSSREGSLQQEDEEFEEIEEVEEEKGRSLKRVLEFLVWSFLFVLSTLYISSMNAPAPSLSLQSFEGLNKGGYHKILNRTSEALLAVRLESGSDIWDRAEEIQLDLGRGHQRDRIEEQKMVEDVKIGVDIAEELNEVIYLKGAKSKALEVVEDRKKGTVDELREMIEPQAADIDEGCDHKIKNFSDMMIDNPKLQIGKTIQKFETLQDYQAQSTFDGRDRQIIESDIANILGEGNDFMVDPAEEVNNEQAGDEDMIETKMDGMENLTLIASEDIGSERMSNGDTDFEILNLEAEGNLEDSLTKHLEIELLLLKAIIGASVFSVIVAFLVWGFHHKRMKTSVKNSCLFARPCFESLVVEKEKTIGKDSSMTPKPSLIVKPRIESVIAEKHSSVLCNREEIDMERFGSFVSYSSFHAVEECLKDNNESGAPTIELLGEFVFGEVSSSQSWDMKNWRIESEESEYSVSTEKSRSKVHSDHVQLQPAFSELSTMDSHSCARYTSGKKIVKEEGCKDGEAQVITTPARRSSRIRNRPVISP